MKKGIVIFAALSFTGLAVFGFAAMAGDVAHGHLNCIAVAVNQTTVCPESSSIASFVFHTSALKKFSTAVFALTPLFLILGLFAVPAPSFILPALQFSFIPVNAAKLSFRKSARFLNWLSLHEASPQLI